MPQVPKAAFERCFDLSLDVYEGRVSARRTVEEATALGMNPTSARDIIYVVRCMAEGRRYARGMSAPQTDFALGRIREKFGNSRLKPAITACEGHIEYYERLRSIRMRALRAVLFKYEALIQSQPNIEDFVAMENAALADAIARSPADRASRLANADPIPKTATVTATVYVRNPDVTATVLTRAGGVCEGCAKPAPFLRLSNGLPYLEVHHKHRLADGGPDTVANAIALCPNCHREAHYGADQKRYKN
jgi:5-methylcytosine-specific restriction protein A